MKKIEFNSKINFSRAGKACSKVFSYIIDRKEKINEILKGKEYKRYLDKDYFEKEDNESFDESKDLNFVDIFDINYKDQYIDFLRQQKKKYFKYVNSCAFNKQFVSLYKDRNNSINKYTKIDYSREDRDKKITHLDNNPNKDYIYPKIFYSQSFQKMMGRYDRENKQKSIEEKLIALKKKINKNKIKKQKSDIDLSLKNENESDKNLNEKNTTNDEIKAVDMDKMLQRGKLPSHHDVRIRTTKGLDIKKQSPNFTRKFSHFSFKADENKFARNKYFTSLNALHKNNLLTNKYKNFFENKLRPISGSKRIFSGFSSTKEIKTNNNSFTSNIFSDKNSKKDIYFTPEFKKRKRTFSSKDFNNLKKTIRNKSFTFNSMSKTNYNFHYDKSKIKHFRTNTPQIQTNSHNNALSFGKMLSRDYVNRIQINTKIGAGMPLSPNYNSIYPKVVSSVKYSTKITLSKKTDLREKIGINISENKNEEIPQSIYFNKMVGRGDTNSEYPVFMNNINSRNAFDFMTVKSLKMNHNSKRKLNNPISTFNMKKSFNKNISNNNFNIKHDSIEKMKFMKKKVIRIKNYNRNLKNIFKKVFYDELIDKNEIDEDIFDIKNNPKLMNKINQSYKNLMSDYYKLNLDHLDKNFNTKKIDGITFELIKSKNKINNKNENNPFKINESEIKN